MPRRLRGEFAHHLLQDIFQRGQPHHLAVLIHHDGDAALILLKILQLGEQRRAGRHKVRRPHNAEQPLDGDVFGGQVQHLAYMQKAHHIVVAAAIHRQTGVLAGHQLFADMLDGRVQVDHFQLAARNHHIVYGEVFQLEQVQQHAAVFFLDELARLQHQHAQFFRGQQGGFRLRLHAQQADGGFDKQIDEPHHRVKQLEQRGQRVAGPVGHRIRAGGGNHLGRGF